MKNSISVTSQEKVALVEFNPTPVECNKCGDTIKSKFEGHFVTCKCGAISVDQTKYYSRYIGNPEDFKKDDCT